MVPPHTHSPIGFTRREAMQIGYSGLMGLGLPSLLKNRLLAQSGTSSQVDHHRLSHRCP